MLLGLGTPSSHVAGLQGPVDLGGRAVVMNSQAEESCAKLEIAAMASARVGGGKPIVAEAQKNMEGVGFENALKLGCWFFDDEIYTCPVSTIACLS